MTSFLPPGLIRAHRSAADPPCYHYGMSMIYRVLIDITFIIHLGWILFLLAGAYWGRKSLTVMAVHGFGLACSAVMQVFGWYCPLTYLEFWLRERHDPAIAYPGSFIAHYAERLIYLNIPSRLIFAVTIVLVLVNGQSTGTSFGCHADGPSKTARVDDTRCPATWIKQPVVRGFRGSARRIPVPSGPCPRGSRRSA